MDRNEKSRATREYIATALILLLEDKNYDDISITDIAEKAGVSRMTYYRNYGDKDDILIEYLMELSDYFIREHLITRNLTLHNVMEKVCVFFKANLSLIVAITKANLSYRLVEELVDKLSKAIPEVHTNTLAEYNTSFYVGGIISIFKRWFETGMNESYQEIADIICTQVSDDIISAFEYIVNKE